MNMRGPLILFVVMAAGALSAMLMQKPPAADAAKVPAIASVSTDTTPQVDGRHRIVATLTTTGDTADVVAAVGRFAVSFCNELAKDGLGGISEMVFAVQVPHDPQPLQAYSVFLTPEVLAQVARDGTSLYDFYNAGTLGLVTPAGKQMLTAFCGTSHHAAAGRFCEGR